MEPVTYIWMDGELVPWDDANVHVLAHGLHYGTGVFEGIRAYEAKGGTAVFRLTEHMERLVASAKSYRIPLEWTADELSKAALELLRVNELSAGYVRPLVFYGTGSMGLNPAGAEVKTIMACWAWGAYLGEEGLERGIRVATSSWRRIDHASLIPNAKGTGGYLNSVLAKQEALAGGYDEALMLNAAGYVAEGSGENLFLVKNGVVSTPPWLAGSLDGITRGTVIELLTDDGIEVVETDLVRSDCFHADEAFFTGTAAEVTPIREIDDRPVGTGEPGPVTRRAQDLFARAVRGELPDYDHWLEYV
ncbi:MAG: branched-chain amino acid transaminase [Acidimicrobiia bacterium]|nr:branched-chain amino acid transaminase [Acidimicrobiia bacterium]